VIGVPYLGGLVRLFPCLDDPSSNDRRVRCTACTVIAASTDARFVNLCREMGLLTKANVAIDGSKFKASRAAARLLWKHTLFNANAPGVCWASDSLKFNLMVSAGRQTYIGLTPNADVLLYVLRAHQEAAHLVQQIEKSTAW